MSGSEKMEVEDGPPPLVSEDEIDKPVVVVSPAGQGQGGKTQAGDSGEQTQQISLPHTGTTTPTQRAT